MEDHANVIDRVTRVVYAEARKEPYIGKIAVAWVIKNRFNHPRKMYGRTITEITQRKHQFAYLTRDAEDIENWNESIRAAEDVFYRGAPDPTYGSKHFLSGDCYPSWVRGKSPSVVIYHHRFYNNID